MLAWSRPLASLVRAFKTPHSIPTASTAFSSCSIRERTAPHFIVTIRRSTHTMAPVVVFQTLAYTGPDQLSASLVDQIKQQDGFKRAFFGPKIEDRTKGVLATEWSSTAAALAYRSSNLVASDEQLAIELASPGLSEPYGQTLDAPCTELFTAYGIEDVFVENTGKFLGLIKETEGFLGAQFGEAVGRGEGEERAARVVIGWRQKEDHDRSKADAESAIMKNIGLIRQGRKAGDLFHVEFKQL